MNDDSLNNAEESLERQLLAVPLPPTPLGLRGEVIDEVRRELNAARWDGRLQRAAVLLLLVGLGMNASLGLLGVPPEAPVARQVLQRNSRDPLIETAIAVAEATDVATGRLFARQLAAGMGRPLTNDELAAIDITVRSQKIRARDLRGEG